MKYSLLPVLSVFGLTSTAPAAASERQNVFHDESGRVTVAVFQQVAGDAQQHFFDHAANVSPDMVAIGGGGTAAEFPSGALLTASYPNADMSAWLVSSKDHMVAQPHRLITYAIGLKIEGMSRDELINSIYVSTADSGPAEWPAASATIPGDYVLVGGGFNVQWQTGPSAAGNLATASFPSTNFSWTARSKDHQVSSPANIRAYAIGLRRELRVGRVIATIDTQASVQAPHPRAVANVSPGFALTGGGAEVHWAGAGNLLWMLQPTTSTSAQYFAAGSKDHNISDPSTITVYSIGIRMR